MRVRILPSCALTLVLACSDRLADGPIGEADLAFCHGYQIVNVQIDPATIHSDDPHLLLASSEGCGPRTLEVNAESSLSVDTSYTGTFTPTNSEISTAIGYDVGATFAVGASTTVLVPLYAYARIDAYPTYQRTTYQVLGLGCPQQVIVGSGTALKPVGVYFQTCGVLGTDPCGVGCVDGQPTSTTTPGFNGDAGAPDDGGAATSGGADAGDGG